MEVPVTRLDAGDEVHTGLSNPLLTALYGRRFSETWSGEAGMQLELPFGETDHSLADDHVMLLPWIGVRRDLGDAWQMSGLLGVSHAIETGSAAVADISAPALAKSAALSKTAHNGVDHGAGAAPVYVNPHGDREIQWRLGLSRVWNRSTAEVFALGQSDISEGISHAEYYARAGLSWDLALTHILGLQTLAHVPVTSARRSEAELGLSVRAAW